MHKVTILNRTATSNTMFILLPTKFIAPTIIKDSHLHHVLTVDLETMFNTESVGKCVIYVHTKLQISNATGSFVTASDGIIPVTNFIKIHSAVLELKQACRQT
jgi:hypothetical protein